MNQATEFVNVRPLSGPAFEIRPGPKPPRVRKPSDGIRLLGPVDVEPLEAILSRLTDNVWREEDRNKPNQFDVLRHTRHVIFRFCDFEDIRKVRSNPGWKIWHNSLLAVMDQASAAYGFTDPVYPKAMFASLAAASGIDPHTDCGAATHFVHKIHVPVRTEPAATFTVGDLMQHLRRGYAYEVNNTLPHGAFNGGNRERVHFIFEVYGGSPP